jgi:hypothetical protein
VGDLVAFVAVGNAELGAFLDIDHDRDRHAGVVGPLGMRRPAAVAAEIALAGHGAPVSWSVITVSKSEIPPLVKADAAAKVGGGAITIRDPAG